ncbi:MAG: hypothetical protein K0R12_1142 [Gammaproteobacteria bacterium]|jgi:outer membrane murein-binding lipoprotein Lpp|nr:hypothetical protein [Gammaproteobacteria bacterium]
MQLKKIVLTTCLLMAGVGAFSTGNAASDSKPTEANVQAISTQTENLEKQMKALQTQLQALKQEQAELLGKTTSTQKQAGVSKKTGTSTKTTSVSTPSHKQKQDKVFANNPGGTPGSQTDSETPTPWVDIRGTTVVTSPYFGPQPQFNGSDLLINTSSVNKDLALLQMRQRVASELAAENKGPEQYSVIALSGEIEGAAMSSRTFADTNSSDLDLTAAEIDMAAFVHPWLLGYVTMEYDNGYLPSQVTGSGQRENNSNLELGKAFLTVGNLDRTPMYFSLGQLYAPFGQYTSYLYTDSLPKTLGRSKVRAAVLGYADPSSEGLYGSVYTFSGESRTTDNRKIDEGGANLGYRYKNGTFRTTGSVSVISNIADSSGMQSNGIGSDDQFQGFAADSSTEQIVHRVPGLDLQGNISYNAYTLIGEYTGATTSFDQNDMSFNGHGASPKAMHVEGVYSYSFYNRPGSFTVGYDHSWEALALNLPRERVSAAMGYSVWRNTLTSFEYRHDINYSSNTTAGGIISGTGSQEAITPAGHTSDTVTLVLDYFF